MGANIFDKLFGYLSPPKTIYGDYITTNVSNASTWTYTVSTTRPKVHYHPARPARRWK